MRSKIKLCIKMYFYIIIEIQTCWLKITIHKGKNKVRLNGRKMGGKREGGGKERKRGKERGKTNLCGSA